MKKIICALADALDLTFDSLDGVPRTQCPIDDRRLIEAGAAGMLPLTVGGELYLVVAPRGTAVRRIIALVEEKPELARRVRFTSSERLTDDTETHAAIARRKSRIPIEVITVPDAGPRTKPKALNVALPFARGSFTVIYDAEDRPDAGQLRSALQAFAAAGDDLACVQASLCIDNTSDSWLAGLFTAEYAGQFDVFMPGIAALRLPLPLGGSSNHFRTATLRKLGGWDAFNVTEDADLGMRLCRFGYRAAMIDSTTYEEAPARFSPWLRQRTRWFKGWMQTWLVHMREPRRLMSNLGPSGFFAFQLIVGGNALAALIHPLFLAGLIYGVLAGVPMWEGGAGAGAILVGLYGAVVVAGYAASTTLACVGLARRGLLRCAWVLALTPLHWLLLSLAAWRALIQLVVTPYRWERPSTDWRKARGWQAAPRRPCRAWSAISAAFWSWNCRPSWPPRESHLTYISAVPRPSSPASASD